MEMKLKEIMASVLEMNVGDITEDASTDTIVKWDSLRQMNLIIALEQAFGVEFDDDEIVNMVSFRQIKEIIEGKVRV